MNSSNSFNICPRCGNSNSLNAKYCSRCGVQLKVPTEAVVCHKCHTRNSSLANFCRNCGATLKVGAQTKICPRCGREIGAEENMCACGYSFVTMQQTEPRRADVSSTNKENKKDKKRNKGKPEQNYVEPSSAAASSKEKEPKKKKSGRGFALFALIFLAAFVVVLILPATARGPLVGFDKGIYHPVEEQQEPTPDAMVDSASQLYAEGEEESEGEQGDVTTPSEGTEPGEGEQGGEPSGEEPTAETWTVTFKNGDDTVSTTTVNKGEKLTAEQIPAAPEIDTDKRFEGWFNGETQITVDTAIDGDIVATAKITAVLPPDSGETGDTNPNPDGSEQPSTELDHNIYGWDLINDIIGLFSEETKAAMAESENAFNYVMNEYFGTSTFMVVAMFAVFMLTAVFHLLVCVIRIISPNRSKSPNYLYLILAVITTILVAMMMLSHLIPGEESGFKAFFAAAYQGVACEYGLVLILIPAYYWFFYLYSCIAKRKTPKKEKKAKNNA